MTSPSSAITTTVFVWDGMSLLQERNESNLLLAQYTWAPETWDGVWNGGELMDVLLLKQRASTAGALPHFIEALVAQPVASFLWINQQPRVLGSIYVHTTP